MAEEPAKSFEIIQPLDKSRYVGTSSTFVIDTSYDLVDTIIITQDNNKTTNLKIEKSKKTYCKTINLHVGENQLSITSYKDNKIIDATKRNIYFLSELAEDIDKYTVEEYDPIYFHNDEKEQKCKSCHNMTSNIPKNNKALEDVSTTTCYECHKGMNNTKNTHAPTANWLCIECHNGQFGEFNMEEEGASKYLAPDPISKACGTCHEDIDEWKARKYDHGPVNDGKCERCHNPHGSENDFFLRKPIWELCITCHAEKADGKHVVSSYVFSRNSGSHPTKGIKDPLRPEREFTCTSCHDPHGSHGTMLLRMKGSMPFSVCNKCHKK